MEAYYLNDDGSTWQDGIEPDEGGEHDGLAFADSWEDEVKVYKNGAKSSKLDTRYDLLPPLAINEVAKTLALGCKKYGEWNWFQLPVSDNMNHALRHMMALNPRTDTLKNRIEHASHAACRALFVLEQLLDEENHEF